MENLNNLDGVEISKQLIDKNYTKGIVITPKYIVVHDTNNKDFGANAKFNRDYLSVAKVKSSGHYLVDDRRIIQVLEDNWRGWHVSDGDSSVISNSNSIAVKLCVNRDNNFEKTAINAFYLIKELMNKYNIPEENVKRHYDITGKICPRPMVEENPGLWVSIKEALRRGEDEEVRILKPLFYGELMKVLTSLNIKETENKRSRNIGTIARGEKFAIYEESDDWYKIISTKDGDVSFGYVSKNYIEKVKWPKGKKKKGFTDVIKTSIIKEALESDANSIEEVTDIENEIVEIVEVIEEEPVKVQKVENRDGLSSDIVKRMAMQLKEDSIEETTPEKDKEIVEIYIGVVYNVITNLPIRKGPAPHFYVIGYLFPNDRVRVIEEIDGWYRIEYQSSKGIREGFVEKLYIYIE